MKEKKIGFTIGKFAPLHKGHQFLIETGLKEMDEFFVVIYDTDVIDINIKKRAEWIKNLYPNIKILYAFNSPKKYGLDKESVNIQMRYLHNIIKDIPVTHFYSSELYGEKVANYLNINNRLVDIEKKIVPISGSKIRENMCYGKNYLEKCVWNDLKKIWN